MPVSTHYSICLTPNKLHSSFDPSILNSKEGAGNRHKGMLGGPYVRAISDEIHTYLTNNYYN